MCIRIWAEESVNKRLDSNNSASSSKEEHEPEQVEAKLDQSVETELGASCRNGAFLVSNSQQHKQDHEHQHFQASEEFSFFQITVQGNKKTAYKLFGVNMTPEMIVIALVYFIQDIIGLSELAISFFLKDDLHLDPAEVSFMPMLVLAIWLFPPGVEATLFTTLMSISNGGVLLGRLIGTKLTQLLGVTSENFQNISLTCLL
ncbi:unnamed protein product [Sphagnum tenellum]